MSEENKRVVRRYFEELDRRRATPVDLCAAGFAFHVAGFPSMDLEATTRFAAIFFSGLARFVASARRINRRRGQSGLSLPIRGHAHLRLHGSPSERATHLGGRCWCYACR